LAGEGVTEEGGRTTVDDDDAAVDTNDRGATADVRRRRRRRRPDRTAGPCWRRVSDAVLQSLGDHDRHGSLHRACCARTARACSTLAAHGTQCGGGGVPPLQRRADHIERGNALRTSPSVGQFRSAARASSITHIFIILAVFPCQPPFFCCSTACLVH